MKYTAILMLLIACLCTANAQYEFKIESQVNCTEVKNQQRTGTCWSFATASFLESELMRLGKGQVDLSEMFVVRNIYSDKAKNYILRQGKANFSQGSLSHDLIRIMDKYGTVPQSVYSGLMDGDNGYDHSEMERGLKGFLDGVRKGKTLSAKWGTAFECIMDSYMGTVPASFTYNGQQHTPKSFSKAMGIKVDNYVSITSFTHHPYFDEFIMEIPDNYSNGSFYNIPLDDLMETIDFALLGGYSIAWDGDVSEKGFSAKNGIAVLPTDPKRADLFTKPGEEMTVTTELRQKNFENYSTTDDHLMHFVGIALDQTGNKYYIVKNSWGEISPYKGFLYMSEAYVRMKTISIMLHKDAIPSPTAKKIFAGN